jgi:hypothetical protein
VLDDCIHLRQHDLVARFLEHKRVRQVVAVAPGLLDGFLDDGVVLDDTRDGDRFRCHVGIEGIEKVFERWVCTCGEQKACMVCGENCCGTQLLLFAS